ncbi:HAD-superfamily hydrolase, subfamily IIB [Poseidonocella pacifica]|uniref:HAD-superfamily hydrolase, subfamily IIB n=1 Tax=Poseidonocella pacifica TaxID=871651 RepID=A0A1I0XG34_9RHOB|nr:HAD-IIB family hydrolase [Poseidonocella pacifica]SFA98903.1 HAD-superfamily hydrolase, subfamily IIB [Poseidonocella pacifica]
MTQKTDFNDLSNRDFVLATDLDGTFLGGSERDRETLYSWIEENRDTIGLVFVTGRDPQFIAELCDGGVPWPEYVVGDVGTTIAGVGMSRKIEPIETLETEIATTWGDSGTRVREALNGHPGLTLQQTAFRYRVSYDLNPAEFDDRALEIVRDMGFDPLISDNRYFDVLPRGISKGPSIQRLVDHLGVARERTLVAGDTMNDFSMLACGLPAVAVGGAEEALRRALEGHDHVYHAEALGAGGILEAIDALNLHRTPGGN